MGKNEVQRVTLTSATGGTWTATFNGQTTSGIAYNATNATVQSALVALSNIASGDVAVTGSAGGPYTITFGGAYTYTDVPEITVGDYLQPDPSVTVATVPPPGAAGINEKQSVTLGAGTTGGTYTLTFGGYTTASIAWNAANSAVQAALVSLTSIGAGNISVTGAAGGPYYATFGGTMHSAPYAEMTASSFLVKTVTVQVNNETNGAAGINELQWVYVTNATGGSYKLAFERDGIAATTGNLNFDASASAVQTALQGLSTIGSGNLTVATTATAGRYSLTFGGTLHSASLAQISADGALLTGGATPHIDIEAVQDGAAATNEQQTLSGGGASEGEFKITDGTNTTTGLTWNTTGESIGMSINGVWGGAANVSFSGGPLNSADIIIEFIGSYAGGEAPDGSIVDNTTNGTPAISETRSHADAVNEIQHVHFPTQATSGTWTLTFGGYTTSSLNWNCNAAAVESALESLDSIADVSVSGDCQAGFVVEWVGDDAGAPKDLMTADDSGLVGTGASATTGTTTNGSAGTNEVHAVTFTGSPTGGTWVLKFKTTEVSALATTAAIAWNASAADIKAALEALDNIDADAITVSAAAPNHLHVTFGGTMHSTGYPEMGHDSWLTGATPTVTVAEVAPPGAAGTNAVQTATIGGSATGGTWQLRFSTSTTTALNWNASAVEVQAALVALGTIGAGNITVAGTAPYTMTFGGTMHSANQADMVPVNALTNAVTISVTTVTGGEAGGLMGMCGYWFL